MTGKRANQGSDRLVPDFINGIDPKRTSTGSLLVSLNAGSRALPVNMSLWLQGNPAVC